jgi:hypothetical protein
VWWLFRRQRRSDRIGIDGIDIGSGLNNDNDMANRVDWGEFEYDGQHLLYAGYARMPPDQLPSFLLTADGDDRCVLPPPSWPSLTPPSPHAWWIAQTRLYDLRTSGPAPSIREIRELLAHAIRHSRLVVPDALREAERNADQFLRLTHLREQFARRHVPPPTPRTSPPPNPNARVPATPSRAPSPRPIAPSPRTSQSSPPGAMSLQGMLAHPTLMSLPLAAPVAVPGPNPHPLPLFTLIPQPGGIPVPAPGPNPPPLIPAYARYAAYTPQAPPRSGISPTAAPTAASSPRVTPPKHAEPMEEDERRSRSDDDQSEHAPECQSPLSQHAHVLNPFSAAVEIDELEDDAPNTRPGSKHGPAPAPRHDAPPYLPDPQPDRPKKRVSAVRQSLINADPFCSLARPAPCPRRNPASAQPAPAPTRPNGAAVRLAPRRSATPAVSNGPRRAARDVDARQATLTPDPAPTGILPPPSSPHMASAQTRTGPKPALRSCGSAAPGPSINRPLTPWAVPSLAVCPS